PGRPLVEREVALPLPRTDRVVEVVPLGALEVDVRLVQVGTEDLCRQWIRLERVDRLAEGPRQQSDAELGYLFVALHVHVAVDGRSGVELALDSLQPRG